MSFFFSLSSGYVHRLVHMVISVLLLMLFHITWFVIKPECHSSTYVSLKYRIISIYSTQCTSE